MVSRVLSVLGEDRASELFEYLILLFIIVSAVTLAVVLAHQLRPHKEAVRTARRFQTIVRVMGRSLFGEDGWEAVKRSLDKTAQRTDALFALLGRDAFGVWAREAVDARTLSPEQTELLRSRMLKAKSVSDSLIIRDRADDCLPTSGMSVSVRQADLQVRGTIGEVADNTLSVWLLASSDGLDASSLASFVLLSRS